MVIVMFIGRQEELDFLNKKYNSSKAEFVVIYGRRRVGKTETISEFCKDKPNLFFSCRECTDAVQRANFSKAVLSFNTPGAEYVTAFDDWADAFAELAKIESNEKTVVVLDEFPYMCRGEKSIPSILQNLWDHTLQHANLMLIISGSSVSFMEEELLGAKNPLFGRATGIYKMEPLPFRDAIKFFPYYSDEEKITAYAILGGIPHYLRQFEPTLTLEENVKEHILSKGGMLYDEVEFMLRQELRETSVYNTVIEAIALGNAAFNDIYLKVQIDKPKLSVYLKNLIDLGIIRREFPVLTNANEKVNVNRGAYRLTDSFFRFWYAFVYNNYSLLQGGGKERVWKRKIQPNLHHFASKAFEEISISYLRELDLQDRLPFEVAAIGRWWGNVTHLDENGKPFTTPEEIDVLASDENEKNFIIGECKFRNEAFDLHELEKLKVKHERKGQIYYYLFSLGGFTDAVVSAAKDEGNIVLIQLSDML